MPLARKVVNLAKATHFGPLMLVVITSFVLAFTQLSFQESILIAAAIFCGQCVVGWTNELVDLPLDSAARRLKKPLVNGSVTTAELRIGIAVASILASLLSFLGPLGVKGGGLHMLGLASASLYNLKLKPTWFSAIPYAFSFGAVPWAIFAAAHKSPAPWLYLGFAVVAVAFHFLNVIKDLEWDTKQGVLGMPQRVGKNWSIATAAVLVVIAIALVITRP